MMEQIKQLREKTGAGIADCKKALEESGGDIVRASEILRERGIAKAAKRADRETSEGIIIAEVNDSANEGYMIEVNSETDFVARNEQFQQFVEKIFTLLKTKKPAGVDELLSLDFEGATVREKLDNLSGVIGEKLAVSNAAVLINPNGSVASYIHAGGRIGVLASVTGVGADIARDIAMQIAAVNPAYITPEDVPTDVIEKEKDVYREQLKNEGKSEEMIEKIIPGKLNKFYEEVCLVKQVFIKDDKKSVAEILGGGKVEKFIRFSLS